MLKLLRRELDATADRAAVRAKRIEAVGFEPRELAEMSYSGSTVSGVGLLRGVEYAEVDTFAHYRDRRRPLAPPFRNPAHALKPGGVVTWSSGVSVVFAASSLAQINNAVVVTVAVLVIDAPGRQQS